MTGGMRMDEKETTALPDVTEPKFGPERLVHEKEQRGFDKKALFTLLASGAICGACMWVAFSWVGGSIDLPSLFGAIVGGVVSGAAIFALS
jgi:hypothetical protein